MSHFAVLVIGDNPEKQLAPYHEFESTGRIDEFVVDVDITEDVRAHMEAEHVPLPAALEYFGLGDEELVVEDEEFADREGEHQYGFAVVKDGVLIKAIDRTNPNKKWDWYEIGGRWTGFFKLKPEGEGVVGVPGLMTRSATPGYVDQTKLKFVDIESMRTEAEQEASIRYDYMLQMCGFTQRQNESSPWADSPWKTWDEVRKILDTNKDMPADDVRAIYHNQPTVKILEAAQKKSLNRPKAEQNDYTHGFGFADIDNYACTRDEYVARARANAMCTCAVVKDGKWYERGEMGWFGQRHDEMSEDEWLQQFTTLIDGLDPETLLTAVDCHI